MLTQSEKPVVGPLYKLGGADSQKLSVATKFKVNYFPVVGVPQLDLAFDICNKLVLTFYEIYCCGRLDHLY